MYDVSTSEYKLDLTNQRCTLDMSRLPSNATGSFDSNPVVTYYYNVVPLEVINGGFENPVMNAPTLCENVYYAQGYTSNQVPGWTGVNNRIELVKKLSDSNLRGAAYEGNQSGELNTNRYDSYYQDFDTIPGETIHWEIYHRSIFGTDTAVVEIGASEGNLAQQKEMISRASWTKYSGSYKVPAGQTKTRTQFKAISAATYPGRPEWTDDYGNLIDAFKVSSNFK